MTSFDNHAFHLQVVMQRMLLLAAVCYSQAQLKRAPKFWSKQYGDLLMGIQGENICTAAGRKLAVEMADRLHDSRELLPLEVHVGQGQPKTMTISIANSCALKEVLRLYEIMCYCSRLIVL